MKFAVSAVLFLLLSFPEVLTWKQIQPFVKAECSKYPSKKVNEYVIHGIMYWESRIMSSNDEVYSTLAKSSDNCLGLMQIKKNTLGEFNFRMSKAMTNWKPYTQTDMTNNWKRNVHVGIWAWAIHLEWAKGDVMKALSCYSGKAEGYERKVLNMLFEFIGKDK